MIDVWALSEPQEAFLRQQEALLFRSDLVHDSLAIDAKSMVDVFSSLNLPGHDPALLAALLSSDRRERDRAMIAAIAENALGHLTADTRAVLDGTALVSRV